MFEKISMSSWMLMRLSLFWMLSLLC